MADNSRVQMDTTGAGSLSGKRVLDKLTSIDRNMALMQKDIRTLVRKSASERGSAFFAREDANESALEAGRVRRGGSKSGGLGNSVAAGAKKGESLMNKLFGGVVTGLLGGLLGVMGKVIGGVAVLGYKLVSKLVASIAAAYGIKGMGDAVEKGKPSWMKKADTATPTSPGSPQTTKPTARPPQSPMTASELQKYEANRAKGMSASEAKTQAQGFRGMSRTADSMAAKKATATAAEGAAGGAAKGGIKGALTQALPVLGKIGGKLSVGLLKTIPFIGPIISLIFDFFEGGEMAESLGVSKAAGIMGTILGGAEGGILNSFLNAGKWAMIGAAIGSVVPVVGTILGGVVGAIIGAIMGYFGGDVIAEKINSVFTGISRFVEDSWNGLKDIGTYLGSQIVNLISQMMAMVKVGAGNMILGAAKLMEKVPGLGGAAKSLTAMGNDLITSGNKDSADATATKDAELKAAKDASSKRDTNLATTREGEDAANVVRQANNEEKKKAGAGAGPGIGAMVADQVGALPKLGGAQGASFPTSTSPQQAGAPSGSIAGGDINAVGKAPSKSLLDMIKAKEGFSAKAFWDHKQWSIGYGTQAKDGSEVISKEEAEKRLSADVEKRKAYVLTFGKKNGYSWGEQQVDALTSFIYNLGYGALDQVTGKGKRSNEEIAKAMLQYNKASGQVNAGLAKRRGEETALFSGGAAASPQMAAAGSGSSAALPASQIGSSSSFAGATGASFPTGAAVSSASTAVSDGRMQLASAPPIVNVTSPPATPPSSNPGINTGSASADVYDRDITKLLVGRAFSFA